MNPMQAVAEEEDQESYSDEDIKQGFDSATISAPLPTTRATNDLRLNNRLTTVQ